MKYNVYGTLTVSAYTVVEADSENEAKDIAEGRETGSLCYGAISQSDNECWHFEGDGEPYDLTVEES